jgi:ferritin-like metal-binding protein YciE
MKAKSLSELFNHELEDLYDGENQIINALPKMAKAASDTELQNAFKEHLNQTRNQVSRLEQVFEILGAKAKEGDCKGMAGLIKEGNDLIKLDSDPEVRDAALSTAAQRVEHYEIAAYGTVRTWARLLGYQEAEQLLQETLEEEKETDQKLNELAEGINVEAAQGEAVQPSSTRTSGRRDSAA